MIIIQINATSIIYLWARQIFFSDIWKVMDQYQIVTVICGQLTVQQPVVELILSDMVQAKAQGADIVEFKV
jgi:predicted phosphatase